MIKTTHLADEVVRPVLKGLDMYSLSAESLMLGTMAQESNMGYYLVQEPSRVAKGICQVEGATHDDITVRYLSERPDILAKLLKVAGVPRCDVRFLTTNLAYNVAIARIKYWMIPEMLPHQTDLYALAQYWDKYYNCNPEHGTAEEFVRSYERRVLGRR